MIPSSSQEAYQIGAANHGFHNDTSITTLP